MGDFIVHRARFFDYQPKAIQSMSYDEILKKLAISRFVLQLSRFLLVLIFLLQKSSSF